jgi:replicative DNA helicase
VNALASQRAEEAILAIVMQSDEARVEIMASGLDAEHFHFSPYKRLFAEVTERYFADDTIDALSIAEAVAPQTSKLWKITEKEAVDKVVALSRSAVDGIFQEHCKLIIQFADLRKLVKIATQAQIDVQEKAETAEVIAGRLSMQAARIAMGSMAASEMLSHAEAGRRWYRRSLQEVSAREAGQELGAFFKIKAIDSFTKGIRPSEVCIIAGEPGTGKSALAWGAVRNFARAQSKRPANGRVGALVLSMEMGESPSGTRIAQAASGIDGEKLRMGTLTRGELGIAARGWASEKEWPLWWNYSGRLRQSQVRAIVVEAVRRYNVGLVIIDHFRFLTTDEKFSKREDADDELVIFLKSNLAIELNLAVICLAHTVKSIQREDKRPMMSDLRGSGMIAAFVDFIAFVYHPYQYATVADRERGLVAREDYELIWEKGRQAAKGTGEFSMELSKMKIW